MSLPPDIAASGAIALPIPNQSLWGRIRSLFMPAAKKTPKAATFTPPPAPDPTLPPAKQLEQFIDALGLKHFKGKEFTPYWSQTCGKTTNSMPPKALWKNIVPTLVVLDALREQLGLPIRLTSTYRSPAYNAAVGGKKGSFHMYFQAIDFQCAAGPRRCFAALKKMRGTTFKNPYSGTTFVFKGGLGLYGTFVHVDTRGYNAVWGE